MNPLQLSVDEQIEILLRIRPWQCPPERRGIVPDYLEQQYARECCAARLGEIASPEMNVLSTLLRSAYTDPIAEVRDQCLRGIGQYVANGAVDTSSGIIILLSMVNDESSKVRCTALEQLRGISQEWGAKLAERLRNDKDSLVSETARGILAAI